ncbi:NAD dependent epimerase/dehydratase family protein [Aspergillus karnatakaensis]|uniref:NAD dependent epimerase/dehydratase family protein n=1 Tax=Aspergillus karnatakaensis TaxID=1810916 RepID=UPI003CCDF82A
MTKVFLSGASGYIGGAVLHSLLEVHPSVKIAALVRDAAKGSIIKKAYPSVDIIDGDLDNTDVIEQQSQNADVVFNLAATNHPASANAIQRGLSSPSRKNPGYWIQMSGATMVAGEEIKAGRFGFASDKKYNDVDDLDAVKNIIRANPGRVVDNLILAQDPKTIRTALIAGPCIHGVGSGPVNKRSIQAPEIARNTLGRKKGFRLGKGENVWGFIHVEDLGALFARLLGAAIQGSDDGDVWGGNGVYFPENGSVVFKDLYSAIATEAQKQGFIDTDEIDEITPEEANGLSPHAAAVWGTNANLTSSRAQARLDWKPAADRPKYLDDVPTIVRLEAESLGLKK